jgi:hypothetical protein
LARHNDGREAGRIAAPRRLALAARAKVTYAIVQELEDILFEYRGDCR